MMSKEISKNENEKTQWIKGYPWTVKATGGDSYKYTIYNSNDNGNSHYSIAKIITDVDDLRETGKATANLVVAAPVMYDALAAIYEYFEERSDEDGYIMRAVTTMAMKKARGEPY